MVVFPLVPVTPATLSFFEGWSKNSSAKTARARRLSLTLIDGTSLKLSPVFGLEATTQRAPFLRASEIKSLPREFVPSTATKSEQSLTVLELAEMDLISSAKG